MRTGWLILLLLILFIPHLFISYGHFQQSMMTDLHLRIIGSRLLEAGRSPYFFHWQPGEDHKLFNPNSFIPTGLNGVTVTPTILWLQLPFLKMSYCNLKLTWWIVEEILLFGALLFTCLYPAKLLRQLLCIFVSTAFFIYSRNWWIHVHAGQYYILFGFIFSLMAFLLKKNKGYALSLLPIAALFKPFFVLASLPWLLKDMKGRIKWFFPGIVLTLLILLLSGSYKLLPEYSKAMRGYSAELLGWSEGNKTDYRNENMVLEECVYKITSSPAFGAGCLFSLQHYLKLFRIRISSTTFYSASLLVFILLFILVTGYKRITASNETLLLSSFLIYIFCELFTPANRNPYNLVQYLGIAGLLFGRANIRVALLMLLGLALNHDFPARFVYQREIGEIVLLLCLYLCLYKGRLVEIR